MQAGIARHTRTFVPFFHHSFYTWIASLPFLASFPCAVGRAVLYKNYLKIPVGLGQKGLNTSVKQQFHIVTRNYHRY